MIPIEHAHLSVAAGSHPGVGDRQNEDRFAVAAYQVSATDPTPALFAIVADGIGGHRAGEVASEIGVEMVSQAVAQSDASQPVAIMQAAIIQASQAIYAQAEADPAKQGMGTTCVCAWVIADRLYTASVGNSRLYLLRGGVLRRLTVDHTWVQEAVEAGALTPQQARTHPNANVIRRYLGSRKRVEVDGRLCLAPGESDRQARANQGLRLQPGDRLILCSDGLHDVVADSAIQEIAGRIDELQAMVNALIAQANQNDGRDNVTVIALEMPGGRRKAALSRSPARQRGLRLLGVLGLVLLAALLVALGWYFGFGPGRSLLPWLTNAL